MFEVNPGRLRLGGANLIHRKIYNDLQIKPDPLNAC